MRRIRTNFSIITGIIIILLLISTASALQTYENFTDFYVISTTTLTDYQTMFTLSNGTGFTNEGIFYTNGTTRADWTDIEWTDTSNTSLSFWMETNSNSTTSTWWIKIPLISNDNTTKIRLHYGNLSQATAYSDMENTFILSDGFPGSSVNTTKWNNGTSSVSGGELILSGSGYIMSKTSLSSPFTLMYRGKEATKGINVNLGSNIHAESNISQVGFGGVNNGYLTSDMDNTNGNGFQLYKFTSPSTWTDLSGNPSFNSIQGTYYIVRIHARSNGIDQQVFSDNWASQLQTATTTDTTRTSGYAGLNVASATCNFDWIAIKKYTATEPFLAKNLPNGDPWEGYVPSSISGIAPLNVSFTDISYNSPTAWNWSFRNVTGDNIEVWFSQLQNPFYTFSQGNYSIRLNSSNIYGYNITPEIVFVNVSDQLSSIVSFTSNYTPHSAPLAVQFNDTSTGTITSWNWSYKNVTGNTTQIWFSTLQNPIFTFGVGNWSIVLNISNSGGATNESNGLHYINVSSAIAAPIADFTSTSSGGPTPPITIHFNDASTNSPTSHNWSFGDGNVSDFENPSHIYEFCGNFDVLLRVENTEGFSWNNKSNYVIIPCISLTSTPSTQTKIADKITDTENFMYVGVILIIISSIGAFIYQLMINKSQ